MDKTSGSELYKALSVLKELIDQEEKRLVIPFKNYLELVKENPASLLRNIFQLFHDMVKTYVGEGKDECPGDPESIGFIQYDCSKLFVEGVDNPFFADRLFANRFIRLVEDLLQGSQQNKIHIFEGPHGCGKSTFLNNLLKKFSAYADTKEGKSYEILWRLDEKLNAPGLSNRRVEISCPSHDHPILIIPKNYRAEFMDELFRNIDAETRHKIALGKEYDWIYKEESCAICKSIFWTLFDQIQSLDRIMDMIFVRPAQFDRRLGEGITVYNPGDSSSKDIVCDDERAQKQLIEVFGTNCIKYIFSNQARTNNGIYTLMDIKGHNVERLLGLHNIISDGVHRVVQVEERVSSLFLALMNPEDKEEIDKQKVESFQERIHYVRIPYILEPSTEVKVYESVFGKPIDGRFLPRVLENFARVVISTRMNTECDTLREWIKDFKKYSKYCDNYGLLLRMAIYSGIIPPWLSDNDKKNFTAKIRRKLIAEAENEGIEGFSGRESIKILTDLLNRHAGRENLITMDNVCYFFKNKLSEEQLRKIPKEFLEALLNWYDFGVLNEVKEALYFYNKKQIQDDLLNFLFAVNYDIGTEVTCPYTKDLVKITSSFFQFIGNLVTGQQMNEKDIIDFVQQVQRKYVEILSQDSRVREVEVITATQLYQEFFEAYTHNLKEKVLQPFVNNEHFREAIKHFGTEKFKAYDTRIKEGVEYMIRNLVAKFDYTDQGAIEVCLYVIDNKVAEKFS